MGSAASQLLAALNNYGLQEDDFIASGDIWFVNASAAQASDTNDGEHGKSWSTPFATLDFAVGCAAVDDIIYLAPGHAETIASAGALTIDVEGLQIKGLGAGNNRPTFTVGATGTAGCDINVDADDVLLQNIIFTITAVDTTVIIDVNKRCWIKNCEFRQHIPSYEAVKALDIGGSADNACDRTIVENCKFFADVAATGAGNGSTHAIVVSKNADKLEFIGNYFNGSFETATIEVTTGETSLQSLFMNNTAINLDPTNGLVLKFDNTTTANLVGNRFGAVKGNTVPATDLSAAICLDNLGTDAVAISELKFPATATAWS